MYRGRLVIGSICLLVLVVVMAVAIAASGSGASRNDPNDTAGPLDLADLSIGQSGPRMRLFARTRGRWRSGALEDQPDVTRSRPQSYLCLDLRSAPGHRRACVGRRPGRRPHLALLRIGPQGQVTDRKRLRRARVTRPTQRAVAMSVRFTDLGLAPGRLRWRWITGWSRGACEPPPPRAANPPPPAAPGPGVPGVPLPLSARDQRGQLAQARARPDCEDSYPQSRLARGRVLSPRIVGCTRDENWVRTHGSRERKRAALTFDDGPSTYTDNVLDVLERYDVQGTFFVVGDAIPGDAQLLSRMLRRRHEIGNHSLHHELYPGYSSIAATSERIEDAVGFRPCTFRPPYGGISRNTASSAWRLGMSNIIWDVDPSDWKRPGSGAVYSRVVSSTRPGSIVLMHDGGGDRSGTVAALPRIVRTLEDRGYELVTVSSLLGERKIWWP